MGLAGVGLAEQAITKPSVDRYLSFVNPGRIAKVHVKEGQQVKAGQVLAQQDDTAERLELKALEAQAEDETRIKAADANLKQKRVDYAMMQQAKSKGVATDLEVQHAELDVTIQVLTLDLAKFEAKMARMKLDQAKAAVDRLEMKAPADGTIERIALNEGESTEQASKILRLVNIDPLWVDVAVDCKSCSRLEKGDPAGVFFPGTTTPAQGKIIHVASVADAASETVTVRVELPNPTGRRAGEHVKVEFCPSEKASSLSTQPASGK